MKVLFDTNVVLDAMLLREPHWPAARTLLSYAETRRLEGWIGATSVTMIDSLVRKTLGPAPARGLMRDLLALFQVAPVDGAVLLDALDLGLADFEDAVLFEAARAAGVSVIVTRNGRDFREAAIRVLSPEELVAVVGVGS